MRAIVHTQRGDASVLHLAERERPEPGAGEVRIRVVVSGVNPTDWKSRSGASSRGAASADLYVPNQDGSGVIDKVGPGVSRFMEGDRVWVVLAQYNRPTSGTAQEYTVVPVERVFPLPANADFELGASIGIPAITAHRALTVADGGPGRLHPGACDGLTVLVAGGAGAVGHAAIQLARWAGGTVITTVSSPAKAALATAAGAHHVVRYTDADAASRIREIAPAGVDLIVEVDIAGNSDLNLGVLKPQGTISAYAYDRSSTVTLDIGANMGLNTRYQFVLLYTLGWDAISNAAADLNAAISDGALTIGEATGLPVHRFSLEDAAAAHLAVEKGAVGKVLVRVAPDPIL